MSHPIDRPFDVGLQTERTALSWQRTALASAVAVLLAARLLLEVIGTLSILFAALGLVATVGLFLIGHRRYRANHTILVTASGDRVPLTSALPLLAWTVSVCALGMFGIVFAVLSAFRD